MPGDDLTAPLGLKQPWYHHPPFGLIGVALLTLLAITGFIWIGVVNDPLGGEPTATVKLSTDLKGVTQHDFTVVELPRELDNVIGPDGAEPARQTVNAGKGPQPEMAAELGAEPDAPHLPLQELIENGPYGPLPRIADNGVRPLDVYAQIAPLAHEAPARIALLLNGVGLNETISSMALDNLPKQITLGLSPYGTDVDRWMSTARQQGNEVLMQVPMEPFDYPDNDAGPHSLLTKSASAQNTDKLHWVMARTTNYIGLVNFMGQRFLSDGKALTPFLQEAQERGLMFVDASGSARSLSQEIADTTQTPFVKVDVVVDEELSQQAIETQLLQLESLARSRGLAVASATAYPITLKQLARWTRTLEDRGLTLIPISAAIDGDASH
ncbi:divergent polysaccharide deacetylase family protein [Pseudovibrio exalbescens]|uniref:divergent polysaccharide deacetylase family protein n=1 Tax=Pseudovibrio exalbescens TaxID=197461 RepID=UPI000C9C5765|nr:divergent polysaccharide deacetylase family protein [Pseudovibrio exalbescens]